MKQVSMKVNQANLVKSLKFSFTTKTTVLGELMQNARRAGATHVAFEHAPETRILRVTDNGCGIDAFDKLLTVAESGWDAEVVATEHPFGIGFLSALFACRHITVVSKGGRISVDTDRVLSLETIDITPLPEWDGVTSITMVGIDITQHEIEHKLKQLGRGFPIPVLLNGENFERNHAIDSGLSFIQTEMGSLFLNGLDDPSKPVHAFDVYLQGLPIYSSYSYGSQSEKHIVHLDSSRFHARLPDRDKLVNEVDVVDTVRTVLQREIAIRLRKIKETVSPEEFVSFYKMMENWQLLSLLNNVPVIPMNVLDRISGYPVCNTDAHGQYMHMVKELVTKSDVESGSVEIVTVDDDLRTEGAARIMFARKRGSLCYSYGLDSGHWIHNYIRRLNDENVSVEMVDHTHDAYFKGEWTWTNVDFCGSYRITVGNDVVEIDDESMYTGQEESDRVIVPLKDSSGDVLTQVASYLGDNDDFQNALLESDQDAFHNFVVANTTKDPAQAISRLLPGFSGCPQLYGKSFVITIDEEGNVASVAAA